LRFIEGEVGDGAVEVDRVADPGDGDGAAEVDRAEPEDQLVAVRPESGRPSVKSRCASYCQSGPYEQKALPVERRNQNLSCSRSRIDFDTVSKIRENQFDKGHRCAACPAGIARKAGGLVVAAAGRGALIAHDGPMVGRNVFGNEPDSAFAPDQIIIPVMGVWDSRANGLLSVAAR
jgi:hypothetical protein